MNVRCDLAGVRREAFIDNWAGTAFHLHGEDEWFFVCVCAFWLLCLLGLWTEMESECAMVVVVGADAEEEEFHQGVDLE